MRMLRVSDDRLASSLPGCRGDAQEEGSSLDMRPPMKLTYASWILLAWTAVQ